MFMASGEMPWYSLNDQEALDDFLHPDHNPTIGSDEGLAFPDPIEHELEPGDDVQATWRSVPVLLYIIRNIDCLELLIHQPDFDEEIIEGITALDEEGAEIRELIFLATNLETGERRGGSVLKWMHPTDPDYFDMPRSKDHGFRVWEPELPWGWWQGPMGMFLDYEELVDATSNTGGFQDWMDRVREINDDKGPSDPILCAWCPSNSQQFCPGEYIDDPETCLGRAYSRFNECLEDAQGNLLDCMGVSTVLGGIGLTLIAAFKFCKPALSGGPKLYAACILVYLGGSVILGSALTPWFCQRSYDAARRNCFRILALGFRLQHKAVCIDGDPYRDCENAIP